MFSDETLRKRRPITRYSAAEMNYHGQRNENCEEHHKRDEGAERTGKEGGTRKAVYVCVLVQRGQDPCSSASILDRLRRNSPLQKKPKEHDTEGRRCLAE